MIPLCDAHNHLQDGRLAPHLEEILAALPSLGLRHCVVNGTSEQDWPHVAELARSFDWILPAFGLHPWFLRGRSPAWFDLLRKFIDETPRASIGEIGLDRWMHDADPADQEKVFLPQLALAAERNLPASIHCLKAWGPLESILQSAPKPARGFLLHSYGGSLEMLPSFTRLGAYFSISGYFAHERKAAQRLVFQKIPADRLLVETDAPDMLPPAALQTSPSALNDPRNLAAIYRFAATLRGEPESDFAQKIAANFNRLFLAPA